MDMNDALQQLIQLELNKAQAAAAPAPVVAKAIEGEPLAAVEAPAFDMDALVAKITASLTPKVEELVEKAIPERERGEGTGRAVAQAAGAGEPVQKAADAEPKTIDELIAKADQGHGKLSDDEKRSIWLLTHKVLSAGLSKAE